MSGFARLALAAVLLAGLLPACVVVDVRSDNSIDGISSDAFIDGYATMGWPADDSLLKIGLFDGRSDGALFQFELWKLARVEVGLLGFTLGIGPFDAGVGILFFDPRPPAYDRRAQAAASKPPAPKPPAAPESPPPQPPTGTAPVPPDAPKP